MKNLTIGIVQLQINNKYNLLKRLIIMHSTGVVQENERI